MPTPEALNAANIRVATRQSTPNIKGFGQFGVRHRHDPNLVGGGRTQIPSPGVPTFIKNLLTFTPNPVTQETSIAPFTTLENSLVNLFRRKSHRGRGTGKEGSGIPPEAMKKFRERYEPTLQAMRDAGWNEKDIDKWLLEQRMNQNYGDYETTSNTYGLSQADYDMYVAQGDDPANWPSNNQ